jgi:hypothetical protein
MDELAESAEPEMFTYGELESSVRLVKGGRGYSDMYRSIS